MKARNTSALWNSGILSLFAGGLLLLLGTMTAFAGSATWKLNPSNGDWNTSANWSPSTIPNGTADTATFQSSTITSLSISAGTQVSAITFSPGASGFTIRATPGLFNLAVSGPGIINDSGRTQNFESTTDASFNHGTILFNGSASAGTQCVFTNRGGQHESGYGGGIYFYGNSTAGDNKFVSEPGTTYRAYGAQTNFLENSSAANATLTANGGTTLGAEGGHVSFLFNSTADAATLIANGGAGGGSPFVFTSGKIDFSDDSTAASATLIANGVTTGEGGRIQFEDRSNGGQARVKVFGSGDSVTRGRLDLSNRHPGLTIGSLEGDGAVYLAGKSLIVGSNDQDAIFIGEISHTGSGLGGYTPGTDSLTKVGAGKLTLGGANLYSGGTTIKHGRLLVDNTIGSGTGTGPVFLNAGALGGVGTIAGAVTVGNGSGSRAFLVPGANATQPGRLTIQSGLTFSSDATYKIQINSTAVTADKVYANGVTINPGAQFTLEDLGNGTLSSGTVFMLIRNTTATPIAGTFVNLPDGVTFTINGNTFRADYQGGDGNDLTLTVQ